MFGAIIALLLGIAITIGFGWLLIKEFHNESKFWKKMALKDCIKYLLPGIIFFGGMTIIGILITYFMIRDLTA